MAEIDLSTEDGWEAAIIAQAKAQADARDQEPESVEPEPQVTEPETTPEVSVEEPKIPKQDFGDLILGKFKSSEDMEKSYQELERRLAEQGKELGQLRQQLQTTQVPQSSLEAMLERDPQQAAVWSLQNNQPHIYEQVMDYWFENDPKNAARFESQILLAQERERWEQVIQPLQRTTGSAEMNQAFRSVSRQHPDITNHLESMLSIARESPYLTEALTKGTQDSREKVIEQLYVLASHGKEMPKEPAVATPKQVPHVASSGESIEAGPRTAQDVLRDQLFPKEPSDLDNYGIVRDPRWNE